MRFPFRFYKAGPAEFVVKYVAGARRASGTGIVAFVGPWTTLASVPTAERAFGGKYDRAAILKWLAEFGRRFFASQFKRNAMPDGPKVGSVALSQRGDWRMPSDIDGRAWTAEVKRPIAELQPER